MAVLSFYDDTGYINRVIDVPDNEMPYYVDLYGDSVEGSYDPEKYCVNVSGSVAKRPLFTLSQNKNEIVADGIDTITISGVVAGATISVCGPASDEWVTEATSFDLTVNVPGNYVVQIFKWPYVNDQVTFNAS